MDTEIKKLIENTDLTLIQIANNLRISINKVRKIWDKYPKTYRTTRKAKNYRLSKLGAKNPTSGKSGCSHHNFKGVVGDSKGYLLVLKPNWYTGRKRSKHIFQHSLIVCENLGLTEIPKGCVVHHCDGNPRNNKFCNLVMLTMAEHCALHCYLGRSTTISKESTLKWVEARRAK